VRSRTGMKRSAATRPTDETMRALRNTIDDVRRALRKSVAAMMARERRSGKAAETVAVRVAKKMTALSLSWRLFCRARNHRGHVTRRVYCIGVFRRMSPENGSRGFAVPAGTQQRDPGAREESAPPRK